MSSQFDQYWKNLNLYKNKQHVLKIFVSIVNQ